MLQEHGVYPCSFSTLCLLSVKRKTLCRIVRRLITLSRAQVPTLRQEKDPMQTHRGIERVEMKRRESRMPKGDARTVKGVFVALIFSLHLASLAGAEVKTDLQKEGLIGPVRTVRIETAQFSNQSSQWIEGPRELSAGITYDVRGNKTEVTGSAFVGKTLYIYNAQGDLTETLSYSPDGSLSERTVYTYDAKGNLMETVSYAPDGSSHRKTVYTYNAQGQLTEQVTCDAVGCFDKGAYTYDPYGNLVEERFYYPDSAAIKLHIVHTYDAQGRRIQTERGPAHLGLGIEKTVETYDANGNILELTTYYTEKVEDEAGKPIPPPARVVYTYKFDARGNWIKQTQTLYTSETGKPVCEPSMVTYRTITYYPETGMP
jgi:antitoxin component YwqK of YwqJK toxin-antitoxin module